MYLTVIDTMQMHWVYAVKDSKKCEKLESRFRNLPERIHLNSVNVSFMFTRKVQILQHGLNWEVFHCILKLSDC